MRLIDKNNVLEALKALPVELDAETVQRCVEIVSNQPTVDAVTVIRCKDCKWYGRADKRRFYRGMDCLQNRIDTIVPDKDYCSRAERKNDDIQK